MDKEHSDNDNTQTHVILTKGTMVSHYRIVEKIGAGGMGEVYLAEDTQLDRKVALKFLPPHLCGDDDCRARFKREAQAAAKLDHPNIVTIHEVSEYQGRPFFAMQHVEGKSLRDVIKNDELDFDRVIELAGQICEGLQKAHEAGIIHRDVKPSNIVVDADGRPKLLDFGLATVQGGEHLTRTGSTLGTIGYMSPEQIEGKATDARSDLFSFGCVMYEMITGRPPFKRDDQTATLKAVLQNAPEPLARYKADVPESWQLVINKLLEKDPTLRYQTAAGVIADLKRIVVAAEAEDKSRRPFWKGLLQKFLFGCIIGVTFYVVSEYIMPLFQEASSERKMLAVLPFQNLGDPDDEYFADGITEEITARLARIQGLGVIGRASAIRYKATDKSIENIGKELGVDYVLSGTVRWRRTPGQGGRVRVTPQLIGCSDEAQVWADIYDESVDDIFSVQTTIAGEVVRALNVALVESEEQALRTQPTANLEAYQYYLRARDIWFGWEEGREDLDRASTLLERAIELDTTFADAYAELSGIHSWYVETGIDRSDERKRLAEQTAALASKYDSLQAYSRVAWGYYYYYVLKDFDRAHEEFEAATRKIPSNSEALAALGYVKRRLGQWEESYELQKQACKLNPYNLWILYGVSTHAYYMRLWPDAEKYVDQELERFPDRAMPYRDKAMLYLQSDGDPDAALEIIDRSPLGRQYLLLDIKLQSLYFLRDYAAALETVRQLYGTLTAPTDTAHYYFQMAEVNRRLENAETSRVYYDSAKVYVEALHASGEHRTSLLPPSLGQIYAGLGLKDAAIEAGNRDTAEIPVHEDALTGMERLAHLALTYIRVGEYDPAVDLIDTLLSIPSILSVAWLRGHPDYDPLRDHPRFQALLEKYENMNE